MSSHYISGAASLIVGGFVIATQAFHPARVGWISFGIAIAIVAVAIVAQSDRSRGTIQRAVDARTSLTA